MPPLPTDIAVVLTGFATVLGSYLKGDKLSNRTNGLIALVALVVAGVAAIVLTTGFTAPVFDPVNLKANILQLIAVCYSLVNTFIEYADLLKYLKQSDTPMAPKPELAVKPTVKDWGERGE